MRPRNEAEPASGTRHVMVKRLKTASIILLTTLILSELALRLILGNMQIPEMVVHPGDGRCVGLRPDSEVEYTGWFLKIPTVHAGANSAGFRGPLEPIDPPPETVRVLLLGDSFTYGQGVEEDQTIAAFLQSELSLRTGCQVHVLNFGCPGYNLEDSVLQYEKFASYWRHDVALYLMLDNDFDSSICTIADRPTESWLLKNIYVFRAINLIVNPFVIESSDVSEFDMKKRLLYASFHFSLTSFLSRSDFGVVLLSNYVPEPLSTLAHDILPDMNLAYYELATQCQIGRGGVPEVPGEFHYSVEGDQLVAHCLADWMLDGRFTSAFSACTKVPLPPVVRLFNAMLDSLFHLR